MRLMNILKNNIFKNNKFKKINKINYFQKKII